jgi:hypothetical protein
MLFRFFDYVFYKVSKGYSKTIDSNPYMAGVSVLSAVQSFNLISILFLYSVMKHDKSIVSKLLFATICIVLVVVNYIRYIYKENRNYDIMNKRWSDESKKKLKGFLIIVYILLSTFLFFGLAIYLGKQKY